MTAPNAKLRDLYIKVWKRALPKFFDWPRHSVDVWVAPSFKRMGFARTLFYHEDPIFYMLPLLIPDDLKERLEPDVLTKLESSLHEAIKVASRVTWRDANFDWVSARQHVELVLREHDASLPPRPAPTAAKKKDMQISSRATPLLMDSAYSA